VCFESDRGNRATRGMPVEHRGDEHTTNPNHMGQTPTAGFEPASSEVTGESLPSSRVECPHFPCGLPSLRGLCAHRPAKRSCIKPSQLGGGYIHATIKYFHEFQSWCTFHNPMRYDLLRSPKTAAATALQPQHAAFPFSTGRLLIYIRFLTSSDAGHA